MQELTPAQRELADQYQVATEFVDWKGVTQTVDAATVIAVLAALGVDARDPATATEALREHRAHQAARTLPPCIVIREDQTCDVPLEEGTAQPSAWIDLEDGNRRELPIAAKVVALPSGLPLGYHQLCVRIGDTVHRTQLIVTPTFLGVPEQMSQRAWGFAAQLYSVRSTRSWGTGDLRDLADLAAWSADQLDADFVLLNPLGAPAPVAPMEPSPYLPSSRVFVNPLYIRVEDIEEYRDLSRSDQRDVEALRNELHATWATAETLDRDAAWRAKSLALRRIHHLPRSETRQSEYQEFLRREGDGLRDFATWCVLAAEHGPDARTWPAGLDPESASVKDFRDRNIDEVDFYSWLQWVLDEQLAAVQRGCAESGMSLGVLHDLAVGVHPGGADVWTRQDVFAADVTVGAPPDAFNQRGQDWSQPPWRPDRLAASAYAPYRQLLSRLLRYAGGVRVDHIIGLFRLWWIPAGMTPGQGTYVRYDYQALIGILALEGRRAGAVVVGEDLGNVEQTARDYLAQRGILGTSILWFESDDAGRPRAPDRWREYSMASVTTHDLPPTAAYLAGSHVELRDSLGLLTRPVAEERAADAAERDAWLERLRADGLLNKASDTDATVEALYEYLTRTPARLVCVALTDAVGDVRTQNQPGTSEEYPNWRIPLSGPDGAPVLLEDVMGSPRIRRLADIVRRGMCSSARSVEM